MRNIKKILFLVVLIPFFVSIYAYGQGDTGKPADYNRTIKRFGATIKGSLPAYFSWKDRGKVTSAKNQGNCASCWAHAAVGAFESKILIKKGAAYNYDLSEQQQVSCNNNMSGCDGGNMSCLKYWYNVGPMDESCAPYSASETPCSNYSHCDTYDFRTKGYYTLDTNNIAGMKSSIYRDGPAYFRFEIYEDFNHFWDEESGVYKQTWGVWRGGHAVLIIGWDDSREAWLCKNSKGKNQGPNGNGTFWIAYSGHAQNLNFGMANVKIEELGGDEIVITRPRSGDNWQIGNTYKVTWESNVGGNLKMYLYQNNTCLGVLFNFVADDGDKNWTIDKLKDGTPIAPGSNYQIELVSRSNSSIKAKSEYFTIVQ